MRVHVLDTLPGVLAGVEDDTVAASVDALGDRDLVRRADELVELAVARGGQGRHIGEMSPGDHQDMRRRLRVDVTEGENPLPVKHYRGRDLSGSDSAEQAVRHTTIIVGTGCVRAGRLSSGQAGASLSVVGLDNGATECIYRFTLTSCSRQKQDTHPLVTCYSQVGVARGFPGVDSIRVCAACSQRDGYSCLFAILRRLLGWSYRMWVGQCRIVAQHINWLRSVMENRHGRER